MGQKEGIVVWGKPREVGHVQLDLQDYPEK